MASVALLLLPTEEVAALKISQQALAEAIIADDALLPEDEEAFEDMPDDINVEEDDDVEQPAAPLNIKLSEVDSKSAKTAKVVTEQQSGKNVTTWIQPTPEKKQGKTELATKSKNLKAVVHDQPVEQAPVDLKQLQKELKEVNDQKDKLNQDKAEFEKHQREIDDRETTVKQNTIKLTADLNSLHSDQSFVAEQKKSLVIRDEAISSKEKEEESKDLQIVEERDHLAQREKDLAHKEKELKDEFGHLDDEKRALYLEQLDLQKRQKAIDDQEIALSKRGKDQDFSLGQKSEKEVKREKEHEKKAKESEKKQKKHQKEMAEKEAKLAEREKKDKEEKAKLEEEHASLAKEKTQVEERNTKLTNEEDALNAEKKTMAEKSTKMDDLEKALQEERDTEKKSYDSLREKLNKELGESQDERKSFAGLKKKTLDEEKDRLGKLAANQLVADQIRVQDQAKKDVESAQSDFAQKEKSLRKTVLDIERAEDDMETRTAQLVQEKMDLMNRLHGAQEDVKVAHKQFEEAVQKIHEGEARELAYQKTEDGLKSAVAGRDKQLTQKDIRIAKEESDLKDAATRDMNLEGTIKHERDESKVALAKLRNDLETDYKNRLENMEARNLAQQKKQLESQKAQLTQKSEEEVATITALKAKAEKEEQELSKKVAESAEQILSEKEKIASLAKAKKEGDEFKRQVLAQRQSLAQSESRLTQLETELNQVHADYDKAKKESATKIDGLSQQLAQIKTTEEKDAHKLTAMHQVVEDKDALIKKIETEGDKFQEDIARSTKHIEEIEREAAESKSQLATVTKELDESKAQAKKMEELKKKAEDSHKTEMQHSLVQVESAAQAQSKAAARISDLEKSLAQQKEETANKEKSLNDADKALDSLHADIAKEKADLEKKEKVEAELQAHVKEDEDKLSALESQTKSQSEEINKDKFEFAAKTKHEDSLQATLDSATKDLNSKLDDLKNALHDKSALTQKTDQQSHQLTDIQKDLEKARAEIAEKMQLAANKENALKEADTRLNQTKADVAHLENKSNEQQASLAKSEESQKGLEEQLKKEHDETVKLQADLEAAQKAEKEAKESAEKQQKMQNEIKTQMSQEVASLAKQRDEMNATITDKVVKMEVEYEMQKKHIEAEANKAAMMRANATMSRRQKENERKLDEAVNLEREKVKREARQQILEEDDANAILDKTRDWQEDMEEKRYESYMKNFAVQTGQQVIGAAQSKEDETPEKKEAAKSNASKPDKQLAAIAKVVDDKKADKIAEKVVEKDAKKDSKPVEDKKDAKDDKKDSKKAESPEIVIKIGNITDGVAGDPPAMAQKDEQKKSAPVAPAIAKKEAKKKSEPTLGKSAKLQVAAVGLNDHVDEPQDMKDDDGSGELPKSMDQEDDEASDSKKPEDDSVDEGDESEDDEDSEGDEDSGDDGEQDDNADVEEGEEGDTVDEADDDE